MSAVLAEALQLAVQSCDWTASQASNPDRSGLNSHAIKSTAKMALPMTRKKATEKAKTLLENTTVSSKYTFGRQAVGADLPLCSFGLPLRI